MKSSRPNELERRYDDEDNDRIGNVNDNNNGKDTWENVVEKAIRIISETLGQDYKQSELEIAVASKDTGFFILSTKQIEERLAAIAEQD